MQALFEKAAQAILRHRNFVITTHINPDGDGIGSELGLSRFLRDLGKNVAIINSTSTPRNYRFLDPRNEIIMFPGPAAHAALQQADGVFILDISRWERLGKMQEAVQKHPGVKICIDHHPINGDFADINLVCQEACASGMLVLQLLTFMNGALTTEIAEPLYAAILTDTGAFRFPNTTAETHLAVARLLTAGVCQHRVYEQIYERCSPERVHLLGLVLCNLQYMHCGRLAWGVITRDMLQHTGVEQEETDGFVDIARGIRSVEASLLFIELSDNRVKVSLRSRGGIDVNRFAMQFGGGGHQNASGILLDGPLDKTVQRIITESATLFPPLAEKLVS